MFQRPWAIVLSLLSITALAVSQTTLGLIDTLVASGASKFASSIQSDPEVLQIYLSGEFQTIFAPSDSVFDSLQERALTPRQRQQATIQATKGEVNLGIASRTLPGAILETANKSPQLDDKGQKVITDTRPSNVTRPTKRWNPQFSLRPRQASNNTTPSLLRITAGLGNTTNVIKGDIPFNGGLIHITDSFFTLPESLSSTSQATGQTAFAGLLSKSNMTSTLDSTHSVTVFFPSNAAFSATNTTASPPELLTNHVVAGTVSYLPDLTDGTILKTQRGESLAISVRSGIYYVNGARITQANLILSNGVGHVIDKVLTPKPFTPPVPASAPTKAAKLAGAISVTSFLVLMSLI
ncbi:FAS1 domain-containing protein [Nemania abortiva]|nr:FAS1 domain-containing protein [Nemania abortiva]